MIKDVIVNITRETAAVTQAGFGLPLVISTEAEKAYGEYASMTAVAEDYASSLKAHDIAAMIFGQSPQLPKIAMVGIDKIDTAEFIDELNKVDSDFYFVLCDTRDLDLQKALSTWAAANGKMYFTGTDSAAALDQFDSERTVMLVHDQDELYGEAGWIGTCAPKNPGSITWKFKGINNLPVAKLSLAQITAIHEANGNTYVRKLGYAQTSAGVTTSGEYIDNIRSEDFIKARMVEEVSQLLFSKDKVPYTDQGIALVADRVRNVLRQATNQGIIAMNEDGKGDFTVTVPRRADVAANDVANRVLRDVYWTATLAGAVETVTINGVLTY